MERKDMLWNMFRASGDITYYLLYRQASKTKNNDGRKD